MLKLEVIDYIPYLIWQCVSIHVLLWEVILGILQLRNIHAKYEEVLLYSLGLMWYMENQFEEEDECIVLSRDGQGSLLNSISSMYSGMDTAQTQEILTESFLEDLKVES